MVELPYACARIGCAERAVATDAQRCSACGHATQPAKALVHRGTRASRQTMLVSDLVLVRGFGHGMQLGQPYDLLMTQSGVVLQTPDDQVCAEHVFDDITLLQVCAPEQVNEPELFFAGLDVGGVPFLSLASELLKVMVEPRAVRAVVQLGGPGREYTLAHETMTHQQVAFALAPLTVRLRDLRHDRERTSWAVPALPAAPQPDLVERLSALAKLRSDGFLTEDEFTAAKDKLLR